MAAVRLPPSFCPQILTAKCSHRALGSNNSPGRQRDCAIVQVILRVTAAAACGDVARCCIRCTRPLESQCGALHVWVCTYGHRRVTELLSTPSPMSCTNKLPPLYLKCACRHILNIVNNSTHAGSSVQLLLLSLTFRLTARLFLSPVFFLFFFTHFDDLQTSYI